MLPHNASLTVNVAPRADVGGPLEGGDLLAAGTHWWLAADESAPEPAAAPAELADKPCPVCGGALKLAPVCRCPLLKVNVEPNYPLISVRVYDLRPEAPAVCLECQMTDAQYAAQRHPASCDGGEERPTGSPRATARSC